MAALSLLVVDEAAPLCAKFHAREICERVLPHPPGFE